MFNYHYSLFLHIILELFKVKYCVYSNMLEFTRIEWDTISVKMDQNAQKQRHIKLPILTK